MNAAGPLVPALGLQHARAPRLVQIIGGGGKTTLMFALAHELRSDGAAVVTTTTTRIWAPSAAHCPALVLTAEHDEVLPALQRALDRWGHVTLGQTVSTDGKLLGVSPAVLEGLQRDHPDLWVIAECDGAAGRSLKAHAPHEPALAQIPSLVIAVLGLDIIGAPLDPVHVHRASLLAARLGLAPGTALGPDALALAVAGPGGYLDQLPPAARACLLLTKLDAQREAGARALVDALHTHPSARRLERVLAASESDIRLMAAGW